MQKGNYQKFSTEEFVLDKEFSVWVSSPDLEKDLFWEKFLADHPEKSDQIRDAALIIKSLQPIEPKVSEQQLNQILQKVKAQDSTKSWFGYRWVRFAAGIVLIISIGSLIWLSVRSKNQFPLESANEQVMKGKVIFANGATKEFDTEQTTIKQTTSGGLTINNDTIDDNSDKETSAMNRIIIPYGKRSDITLADGTHIWLNSGSQLSYPSEFKSDSREVFLSGEAFFDVQSNPDKPFYVVTQNIRIKVLGTRFNVSSYNEDNTTQTVLVEGKVVAGTNKLFAKTIDLVPGERMIYDKSNENLSKDRVDVRLFASWVSGYLIFENEPITEVYKKLERYYNQQIAIEGSLEQITFSGKLDLKDNIKDVLENMSFASSVNVLENNGSFTIKN